MKNLLKTATECIDKFARRENKSRLAAIIGGEAVILHGIPRITLDVDIIFYCESDEELTVDLGEKFAGFLKQEIANEFIIEYYPAGRDPIDPLRHDLIRITDAKKRFKKLDILIANYEWELEGFRNMESPEQGSLQPYPIPYLVGLKLMAAGGQDEEDIRNLFLILGASEKEITWELARRIKRDRNLRRILSEGRRAS